MFFYSLRVTLVAAIISSSFTLYSQPDADKKFLYSDEGSQGQKKPIDFAALDNWQSLMPYQSSTVMISDNGQYCSYQINNGEGRSQTIVQATDGSWKQEIFGRQTGEFSGDSRWFIYPSKDSLILLPLGGGALRKIASVSSFQTDGKSSEGKVKWVAWQSKSNPSALHLLDLETNKEQVLDGVKSYMFDKSGRWLACRLVNSELLLHPLSTGKVQRLSNVSQYQLDKKGSLLYAACRDSSGQRILRMSLTDGQKNTIWQEQDSTIKLTAIKLNEDENKLLYMSEQRISNKVVSTIGYWTNGMKQAKVLVQDGYKQLEGLRIMPGGASFSTNDQYILFNMQSTAENKRKPVKDAVQVDIWHYKDTVLQSEQLLYNEGKKIPTPLLEIPTYQAAISTSNGKIVQLGEIARTKHFSRLITGDFAVVIIKKLVHDRLISPKSLIYDSIWLHSLKDDSLIFWRRALRNTLKPIPSPNGHYLVWFDQEQGHYFSFDWRTRQSVNISASVPVYLGSDMSFDSEDIKNNSFTGILGWLPDDGKLLVYDTYDIWQLDPAGRTAPVNLTNGYGRRNNIKLRLTEGTGNNASKAGGVFAPGTVLLLTALDLKNMENGFYRKQLNRPGDPEKLFMGPYVLDWSGIQPNNGEEPNSRPLLKARDADVWLVTRQSAQEAPNYFITRDLKTYQPLTYIRPQEKINWSSTELMRFEQMDGTMSQGVLYKPENFDPNKKYPIIINYYYQFSQLLHEYPVPKLQTAGNIDIPWFVSRGYLVFRPDIHFTTTRPRPASAWNTVEGAGRYLKTLPYVDGLRMGICGHSRGGGYTNYIITHSTQFAAALEGAGVSDWVSSQLQLVYTDGSVRPTDNNSYIYTNQQFMMDNPILNVDKVTSPLLIFHCKSDGAVPFEQAVEMYIAMRREGKKVWLLQYDGEGHTLQEKKNKQDLTIRSTQFFDHYLKGAPAPVWMTRGVPAKLKGIETGLELDNEIKDP